MIEKFATQFQEKGFDSLVAKYQEDKPSSYDSIFDDLIAFLREANDDEYSGVPDPNRVTVIDHGDYQGTRVWVVGETGYQPHTYFVVKVGYGSCSGCDTFEAIENYGGWDREGATADEAKDYATLALHMVQSMKEV